MKTHHHGVHVACHNCEDPTCNCCLFLTEQGARPCETKSYCRCAQCMAGPYPHNDILDGEGLGEGDEKKHVTTE